MHRIFFKPVYLQIQPDRMVAELLVPPYTRHESLPDIPYGNARLLIGNLDSATRCMKKSLEAVCGNFMLPRPSVLLHPKSMDDGGLTELEVNALVGVAMDSGVMKVELYSGDGALSKDEALHKLKVLRAGR